MQNKSQLTSIGSQHPTNVLSVTSELAGRPFNLLRRAITLTQTRRTLAREGVDAQITMPADKPSHSLPAKQSEQPHPQKRKRVLESEKELNGLAERIKKLRLCGEEAGLSSCLWELLDEVV